MLKERALDVLVVLTLLLSIVGVAVVDLWVGLTKIVGRRLWLPMILKWHLSDEPNRTFAGAAHLTNVTPILTVNGRRK